MGARSNIVIQSGSERVYLYGHWMACNSIEHAAHGLRSDRYDDASFLARIVFESMTAGTRGSEIGYGISASLTDNQFPILVIDSKHAFAVRGTNTGRGEASIWFEDEDGIPVSRVYSRRSSSTSQTRSLRSARPCRRRPTTAASAGSSEERTTRSPGSSERLPRRAAGAPRG